MDDGKEAFARANLAALLLREEADDQAVRARREFGGDQVPRVRQHHQA